MLDVMPKFKLPDGHPLIEGDILTMWDEEYEVLKIEHNVAIVDKVLEQVMLPKKIYYKRVK